MGIFKAKSMGLLFLALGFASVNAMAVKHPRTHGRHIPVACTEGIPTLTFNGLSSYTQTFTQQFNYGTAFGFPLVLTNNDLAGCDAKTFTIVISQPTDADFIRGVFLPSYQSSIQVTLDPGASAVVNPNIEISFAEVFNGAVPITATSGNESATFTYNYNITPR